MKHKRLWFGAAGVALVGLAIAIGLMYEPSIAPIAPPARASFDPQRVRAGARVVALGDCIVCHTAKDGQPFAGGLPLATPFGTIYATNITPDADTGIGRWSQDAFARALRSGIARDGHLLYPAFPYIHFTRMSDDDIAAAYAYLMTREPVRATAPANDLIFPLNFRPPLAFWNILFLRKGAYQPDPSQSAQWNRGKALVDGLGHCASCHSPLNAIGGEQAGKAFDGGIVDGWEAPPLNTLGHAARPWTQAQLVTYLRTGRASEHGAAAGPMLPVTRDLATVPVEDVEAIATYILSIQKPGVPRPAASAEARNAASPAAQRGAVLFQASCAQCHGPASPMQSIGERPTLAFSSALGADTPRNAIQMILNGNGWHGEDTLNYMPSYLDQYDDAQIADLAAYIRAAYSDRPAWTGVEAMAAKLRKEDSAQ
ncbi:cytochrome C [Burkholderia diffusa]|uniref:Cytochrome C n=1 Tax=Burkholderia diffusa TaxID=488732 RepID=A0AAW3P7L8_9BURK|nr:c-type cytochrome [Burkholderia diffusa]KWF41436.1 cytochrome C [Burkholderia diffusa]KWF44260.1 cytochrome C [Burkholderia diffusa]KWF45169.1 cytochrome C [Burkholderia diffusa]KWF51153.1 cytochrome C [Burkholderia diffusa]